MTNYNKIKSAILNKNKITAVLKDIKYEFCPYFIGNKDGFPNVVFYSSSEVFSMDNWVCTPIHHLSDIEILEETFINTVPNLPNISPCIDEIDFMIDFKVDI